METILKYKIKTDFRNQKSVKTDKSNFLGREKLISRFSNIAENRVSSTVLIGGARGIGKTSFVREALSVNNSSIPKIVIQISLAEVDPEDKDIRKTILSTLIRGLYFELKNKNNGDILKDPELSDSIEDLYEKTYYSEFEKKDFAELVASVKQSQEQKSIDEKKYHFEFGSAIKTLLKATIGALTITPFLTTILVLQIPLWAAITLFFLGLAFLFLVLSVDVNIMHSTISTEGIMEKVDSKSQKTGIAKLDISSNTLEIGLRQILLNLSDKKQKVIFVIDELDKLDGGDSPDVKLEDHYIYKVIKPLKNLFTLSGAVFVFIVSNSFYYAVTKKKKIDPYSTFHTLFTDRIFLDPLYYKDIERILDSYVDGEIDKSYKDDYFKFRYYVSWLAKNHIFDLHNIIENFIEYENKNTTVHLYKGNSEANGSIEERWEVASALQVFLSATFDEKSYPADSEMNEQLYLTLRQVAEKLYSDFYIEVRDNKFIDILSESEQKQLRLDVLDIKSKEDISGSIEDMLLRMERVDKYCLLVSGQEDEDTVDESNPEGEKEKKSYIYFSLVDNDKFPVIDEVRKTNAVTTYEEEFIKKYNLLGSSKLNLENIDLQTFSVYDGEYKKFSQLATKIINNKPRNERKSLVLEYSKRIEEIQNALYGNSIDDLLSKLMKEDSGLTKWDIGSGKTGVPLWDADAPLSKFYQELHNNTDLEYESDYVIIHDESQNRYTVLGFGLDTKIQDIYSSVNRFYRFRRTETRVINLTGVNTNNKNIWKVVNSKDDLSHLKEYDRELRSRFNL